MELQLYIIMSCVALAELYQVWENHFEYENYESTPLTNKLTIYTLLLLLEYKMSIFIKQNLSLNFSFFCCIFIYVWK